MIAKILINTSVNSLNKVYDYLVPDEMLNDIEVGKRVSVSFGRGKNLEEGIVVKLEEKIEETKYKLKEISAILDDVSYIDEKRLKLAKYIAYIYFCNVYDALKLMLPPGTKSKNSSKSIDTRKDSVISLLKSHDEIMQDIQSNVIKSAKQIQLLTFLMYNEYVLVNDIIDGLSISRSVINTAQKNGYIKIEKVDKQIDFLSELNIKRSEPLKPTDEQKYVIDNISKYIYDEEYKQCLIHGVTGSGKTEVYLQLIDRVLTQGRKAIVLVPEISLTYQTVERFVSRFGNDIAILHSKMTIAQRKDEYKRIKRGEVNIVVGARSAIFAPIDNIGLIIIDEEHDTSYYSQTKPKYSTKDIAAYICKENNAVLVLGSATPEIGTYTKALNGIIELFEMKNRAASAKLPDIEIVDLKEDRVLGNTSNISIRLKEAISENLKNKEQTMLFLNKRGYNSYLTCKSCGYVFNCPNCDVAMTYHKANNLLLCHYCSHVEKNIRICPKCGSEEISSYELGTEKLEEELKDLFPSASILRMDADTTVARDSQQKILDKFKNESIDILIGTQMISKGHDMPNVTLVGIIGADALLAMNDFSSSERAFQNIYQVSGRAGRGKKVGRVLIQTSDSENYIIQAVKNNSYTDFYKMEIDYRKTFGYPPFIDILLFEISGKDFKEVKAEAEKLYNILNFDNQNEYRVFSPKSPYIQRLNNRFRINVMIKARLNSKIYSIIYNKIKIYNIKKKSTVSMSVTKNPIFI